MRVDRPDLYERIQTANETRARQLAPVQEEERSDANS
jgi:hypothetical protein